MGFFFNDPPDRIKHNELKKEFKKFNLSGKQQNELLEHFETHKRDAYDHGHVKEILHKIKNASGDSFSSMQIERVEKGLLGTITSRKAAAEKPKEIKVTDSKESTKKISNVREFRRPTVEGPKPETPPTSEAAPSEPIKFENTSEPPWRKAA